MGYIKTIELELSVAKRSHGCGHLDFAKMGPERNGMQTIELFESHE